MIYADLKLERLCTNQDQRVMHRSIPYRVWVESRWCIVEVLAEVQGFAMVREDDNQPFVTHASKLQNRRDQPKRRSHTH
jgi:hypothetical protein